MYMSSHCYVEVNKKLSKWDNFRMSMIPISVDKGDYTGVIHNCSRFAQHCSEFHWIWFWWYCQNAMVFEVSSRIRLHSIEVCSTLLQLDLLLQRIPICTCLSCTSACMQV